MPVSPNKIFNGPRMNLTLGKTHYLSEPEGPY